MPPISLISQWKRLVQRSSRWTSACGLRPTVAGRSLQADPLSRRKGIETDQNGFHDYRAGAKAGFGGEQQAGNNGRDRRRAARSAGS